MGKTFGLKQARAVLKGAPSTFDLPTLKAVLIALEVPNVLGKEIESEIRHNLQIVSDYRKRAQEIGSLDAKDEQEILAKITQLRSARDQRRAQHDEYIAAIQDNSDNVRESIADLKRVAEAFSSG